MKKYEFLEHKADLKIRAFGKTKEELFLNMLLGMEESLKPAQKEKKEIIRKIKIKSLDLTALLVDFLNEALYLNQIRKEIYFKAGFSKFSGTELEVDFIGKEVENFGEDIKAATYNDLNIRQNEDGYWEAIVVFDI